MRVVIDAGGGRRREEEAGGVGRGLHEGVAQDRDGG